jgi:predicted lipoprotein with Yx(FWY)xxD motif
MSDTDTDGYGKRPLWQWIVLYLAIGGILYALVYYVVIGKRNGYSAAPANPGAGITAAAEATGPVTTKTVAAKGTYLTDTQGRALYVWDTDKAGTSSCTGSCAVNWPPYGPKAGASESLPDGLSLIDRQDASRQFAWHGKPLYYYVKDKNSGDTLGDGIGAIWHLAKP